jgi:hypothetical protein
MVSSTVLTLIVIPAIYYLWKTHDVKKLAIRVQVNEETDAHERKSRK